MTQQEGYAGQMSSLRIQFDRETDVFVVAESLDGLHGEQAVIDYVRGGQAMRVSGLLGHERAKVIEDDRLNYRVNGVEYYIDLPDVTLEGDVQIAVA